MVERGMTESSSEMAGLRGEKQRKRDGNTIEKEPTERNGKKRWGSSVEGNEREWPCVREEGKHFTFFIRKKTLYFLKTEIKFPLTYCSYYYQT